MTNYSEAGVDIVAGVEAAKAYAELANDATDQNVVSGIGGFAAAYRMPSVPDPLLISASDGVGTKLLLALQCDQHDTIGIDLVAMVANDLLAAGATPLFFQDYLAVDQLRVSQAQTIVKGISYGCHLAQMALVGGETAEMPGMYPQNHYDLAGFGVGVVTAAKRLPRDVTAGDVLIGLPSTGVHSNGFSLVRHILAQTNIGGEALDDGTSVMAALMRPTRIYVKEVLPLLQQELIHAVAHITGGGLIENLPRVIPDGLSAEIAPQAWQWPQLFTRLQEAGSLSLDTMRQTFNLGIGMVLVVPETATEAVLAQTSGSRIIGRIRVDAGQRLSWRGEA